MGGGVEPAGGIGSGGRTGGFAPLASAAANAMGIIGRVDIDFEGEGSQTGRNCTRALWQW